MMKTLKRLLMTFFQIKTLLVYLGSDPKPVLGELSFQEDRKFPQRSMFGGTRLFALVLTTLSLGKEEEAEEVVLMFSRMKFFGLAVSADKAELISYV